MVWVLDWSASTGATRLVALAVAEHADKHGRGAWPSLSTISRRSTVSRGRVPRCLQALEQLGELERCGFSEMGTVIYRFPMRKGGSQTRLVAARDQSPEATGVVASRREGSRQRRPEPSLTVHEPPKTIDPVVTVYEHWKAAMNLNGHTKLTEGRRRAIRARLNEGYAVEQLLQAVAGCAASEWHQGQNDRKRPYNDLTLICRNGEKVEQFIGLKPREEKREPRYDQTLNR